MSEGQARVPGSAAAGGCPRSLLPARQHASPELPRVVRNLRREEDRRHVPGPLQARGHLVIKQEKPAAFHGRRLVVFFLRQTSLLFSDYSAERVA